MQIDTERRGAAIIARVREPRIDAAAAIRFKDAMRDVAGGAPEGGRVVLDLAEVAFVDSSGLGAIVSVMKMLAPGRRLELAALQPNVEKVFRLTRMDTVFAIHPGADELGADAA